MIDPDLQNYRNQILQNIYTDFILFAMSLFAVNIIRFNIREL